MTNTINRTYTTIPVSEVNLNKLKKYKEEEYSKIRCGLELIWESQKINQKDLHLGFIGLAGQNSELLESNKKLNKQLETVVKELDELKKERKEKVFRKEACANRKRLPKRDRVTLEIYQALINTTEAGIIYHCSNYYIGSHLKVALYLFINDYICSS